MPQRKQPDNDSINSRMIEAIKNIDTWGVEGSYLVLPLGTKAVEPIAFSSTDANIPKKLANVLSSLDARALLWEKVSGSNTIWHLHYAYGEVIENPWENSKETSLGQRLGNPSVEYHAVRIEDKMVLDLVTNKRCGRAVLSALEANPPLTDRVLNLGSNPFKGESDLYLPFFLVPLIERREVSGTNGINLLSGFRGGKKHTWEHNASYEVCIIALFDGVSGKYCGYEQGIRLAKGTKIEYRTKFIKSGAGRGGGPLMGFLYDIPVRDVFNSISKSMKETIVV